MDTTPEVDTGLVGAGLGRSNAALELWQFNIRSNHLSPSACGTAHSLPYALTELVQGTSRGDPKLAHKAEAPFTNSPTSHRGEW